MNPKTQTFYSNGKLLITGEYLVLDGGLALAVPTQFGQSLSLEPSHTKRIFWDSYDVSGNKWLKAEFALEAELQLLNTSDIALGERLLQIFKIIQQMNPKVLRDAVGTTFKTQLDFPRPWGLGTSSTLINNMAQWAKINPYILLEKTFGGSGYDIACAQHNTPITYQLEDKGRTIIETDFNPKFKENLYFVFLNKKQNSREGISAYKKLKDDKKSALSEVSAITQDMIACNTLETFQFLMQSHETIISKIIQQDTVKNLLFKDFAGSIKSLGAWGGDFVLVASEVAPESYFKSRGYDTIIPYQDMIL